MTLLERIHLEESRRARRQSEDLEALAHATGGYSPRQDVRRARPAVSPFVQRALRGELPASDRTFGR